MHLKRVHDTTYKKKRVHDTSQLDMEVEFSYNNWDFSHSLGILNMDNVTTNLNYNISQIT